MPSLKFADEIEVWCFPHPGRQGKAERWEITLEILERPVFALNQGQDLRHHRRFTREDDLRDPVQDLQRVALGGRGLRSIEFPFEGC